ncbi:MAG: S41 family peptidase [Bacteroides sp.]|nr:S41 family peptidase [Bacteroides sp.]MDD2645482.1 S41 family peptidase [Bacteroides sp.]MDD4720047.1 S41 family peptidase [Bacteroides sp.]
MKQFWNKYTKWILSISVVVLIFFFVGFQKGDKRNFELAKNMEIFNAIVKELDLFYVDTLDANVTLRRGIDAMLYSLDPYTVYYPEEDQSELEQMVKGSYGGIGSVISYNMDRQLSMIAEPYEGTPAAKAGLKAGDILLKIDTVDLKGKNNQEVSELLRGQIGTEFNLTVERPGVNKPMDFKIVRQSIQLPTVPYYGIVDKGVGYINLNSFSGNPSKEFKKAFLDLKSNYNIESLVIDVRSNGGGLLDEAIEIVNFFVPRGKTIVTTKGKIKQASSVYKTLREPIDTDIPIAVLVNSSTASSAEILAGALQDLDRAVIIGDRTFGKGLVQVPRSLPYGGNLKVTTSKYYIPSGRCVQAIDYSHRSLDGSAGRVPDSLTTVFYTEIGREVRDGGGVTPDITSKTEKLPNILYYLVSENKLFDFATDYCLRHLSIPAVESFVLSDDEYSLFKKQVIDSDFKYDQQSEKVLANLREIAEFEGYLEGASDAFDALEKKLVHNLEHDLDYFSNDIKKVLSIEIVKRYYYQKGAIQQQLKDDEDMRAALGVLSDPERYKQILSVVDQKEEE